MGIGAVFASHRPLQRDCEGGEGMAAISRRMVWVDASGRVRATGLVGAPTLGGVQAALRGHSNADVQQQVEGPVVDYAPAPVAGTYPSVRDQATLIFAAADGTQTQVILPAPKAAVFMADGQTVDPSVINDIIVAVVAAVQTASGAAVTNYVGGVRG